MLFYRAAPDLSRPTLTFVTRLVRDHRARIGSRWPVLSPEHQALLVLVHLRRNDTFARLAAAFGIGAATAHRSTACPAPTTGWTTAASTTGTQ